MDVEKNPFAKKSDIERAGFNLCLMSLMTLLWTIVAFIGMRKELYSVILILFPILCYFLVRNGLTLFKAAKLLPEEASEKDNARDKKFNYIFIGEGVGILLGVNIVNNIGHPELDMPVIALVVALHFFPLAKLLNRRVLYTVAIWGTVIAIAGILLSIKNILPVNGIMAFTGVGMAVATSGYGLYTLQSARNYISR